MSFDASILRPGDHLLYYTRDLVDWVIATKTWCRTAAHIEVYIGGGQSVASRNGVGVDKYPLRTDGLTHVRRPNRPFDLDKALVWFYSQACGKPYGWGDLLSFLNLPAKSPGLICSEFAAMLDDAGGLTAFDLAYPRGSVPPSYFLVTPVFDEVWTATP